MKKRIMEMIVLLSVIPALLMGAGKNKAEAEQAGRLKRQPVDEILYAGKLIEKQNVATKIKNDLLVVQKTFETGKNMTIVEATLEPVRNGEIAVAGSAAEVPDHYMYTSTRVNFRAGGSIESEILDVFNPNVEVKVITIENGWAYVVYNQQTYGYICYEYLSDTQVPETSWNRWGIDLSEEEVDLLARIVWVEARGESQVGKQAVVEVVFNRMVSGEYGSDLYSVLSSQGQFVSWGLRNDYEPGLEAYEAVYDVLEGNTEILDMGYIFFSTTKANGCDFVKIGNHYFGR